MYDLYGDSGDELLLEAIAAQKETLALLKAKIGTEEELQKKAAEVREAKEKIGEIKESWPLLSMREKQRVVRSCVEKIVITDDTVDVYYTFES